MIGSFTIRGRDCYVQVNASGTIEKMPPIPGYMKIYFAFVQFFKGGVHIEDVRKAARK